MATDGQQPWSTISTDRDNEGENALIEVEVNGGYITAVVYVDAAATTTEVDAAIEDLRAELDCTPALTGGEAGEQ